MQDRDIITFFTLTSIILHPHWECVWSIWYRVITRITTKQDIWGGSENNRISKDDYTTIQYHNIHSNDLCQDKYGFIIKYRFFNYTPSTGKLLAITLPNDTEKNRASSLWSMCPPSQYSFCRYFDSKLEKCVSVIYVISATDT